MTEPTQAEPDRPRGGDGKYTRSPDTAHRDAEACRLRAQGHSYRAIAAQLGMDPGGAHRAVQRALEAIVKEPAEELRTLELERLDRMYVEVMAVLEREHLTVSNGKVVSQVVGYEMEDDGETPRRNSDGERIPIWEPVPDDDPILRAVDRLLKIQERRARLLGLDAETKVNLSGGVTYEIVGVDTSKLQ